MVKNWADHCDSEEESEEEVIQEQVAIEELHKEARSAQAAHNNHNHRLPEERQERVYEFPSEPPYTAYVGNLAYNMMEADDLASAVTALASDHLQTAIKVVHARIMKDRHNDDKPRGFGYVEVETLEQLQKLMELNNCEKAVIAGRRVQVDTANGGSNNRRGSSGSSNQRNSGGGHRGFSGNSGPEVDGNKFRGGRFANKQPSQSGDSKEAPPPAQRASLKLKPRSKPVESAQTAGSDSNLGGSSSNIFGSAKARDEQNWSEKRASEKQPTKEGETRNSKTGNRRGSEGRGSGGRGQQGRGGDQKGRGGHKDNKSDGAKKSASEKKPLEPKEKKPQEPKVAPPAKPAEPEKAATTKKPVANTFAALALDSDSD